VTDDPATERVPLSRAAGQRRRAVIRAGHAGLVERARQALGDAHPEVRAAALGAVARSGALTVADVALALTSTDVVVRRRAAEVALSARGPGSRSTLVERLVGALADPDALVAVGAAWFLAERRAPTAVDALMAMAREHSDVRCREAAVAALGAIGDPKGLPAVIESLEDKPTIRRRATVALAGFDDPRVEVALRRSAEDRDWQVRQAADELLEDGG
jgi:HEAT repeat protein